MSLVGKLETKIEIKSPAGKFHEIISGRPHHTSKISPANIQGCDLHEGEWGKPGSIIYWSYTHDGIPETAKDIIEAIDDENNSTTFKVIEGHLLEKYKNFHIVVQASPKGETTVVHCTLTYEKQNESVPEPMGIIKLLNDVTKDIDAHLTQQA